jgi:hypothetical protein
MQKEMPRQTAREKKGYSQMWKTVLSYKKWTRSPKIRKKGSAKKIWKEVNFVSRQL